MTTEKYKITVNELPIEVVRKNIKNLHLGVYPPNGRIRVAAPRRLSDDAIRLVVIGKLSWIKRQQANFHEQVRQSEREMVAGESHYFMGRRYRLKVFEYNGPAKVVMRKTETIELHMRHDITIEQ